MSARAALWHLLRGSDDEDNLLIYLGLHFLNDRIHVTPYGHRCVTGVGRGGGEDNLLIYLGLHFLNDRIHVTPYGHRCVGVLSTHAWGSRGRGNIVSGLDLHTCTHTSRWYADLLISYLRDVASDLLTRRMATRLLGGQLPEGARRAWATGGEQPTGEAVMAEDVEEAGKTVEVEKKRRRRQLAPSLGGGHEGRRIMQKGGGWGEGAAAGGGAEAEEGLAEEWAEAEARTAVLHTGGGGDGRDGSGGGDTRCWAGVLSEGNCSVQGGMGRSYKVGGGAHLKEYR